MTRVVPFFVGLFWLVLGGLQLVLFLPLVVGNRAVDAGLFRVDGLSVAFGVLWCVALVLAVLGLVDGKGNWVPAVVLVGIGLAGMAYAREAFVLAVGWLVVGLGVWSSAGVRDRRERLGLAACVSGPGVLLLLGWAIGWIGEFAPPAGGVGREWTVMSALVVGFAACALPVGTLFLLKTRELASKSWALLGLVGTCGPFVLAKMLVGGRWDAWGTWTMALMGTAGLLVVTWQIVWKGISEIGFVGALTMLSVAGFGLAPLSPLAGVGAVLLTALAAIVAGAEGGRAGIAYNGAVVLAGSGVGLWLVAQGALSARYGLVAVVALPAAMLAVGEWRENKKEDQANRKCVTTLIAILLVLGGVYPQGVVEWFARPSVEALAGGVGAPVGLVRNWGVGLQVMSANELVLSALPATGIGVAVFLAWVVLYWAKKLIRVDM